MVVFAALQSLHGFSKFNGVGTDRDGTIAIEIVLLHVVLSRGGHQRRRQQSRQSV